MKLTKGMKKALSLLLAGAMVVTGANMDFGTASAADEKPAGAVKEGKLIMKLNSFVVNDDYTMAFPEKAQEKYNKLDAGKVNENGIANIWNDEGKLDVVAEDAEKQAVLSYDGSEKIVLKVEDQVTKISSLKYEFEVVETDQKYSVSCAAQAFGWIDLKNDDTTVVSKAGDKVEVALKIADIVEGATDVEGLTNLGFLSAVEYKEADPTPTAGTEETGAPEDTKAPTEATSGPATETEAPATEAPSEAPATEAPSEGPTETAGPYEYPKDAKDGFKVGMNYVSDGWAEQAWMDFQNVADPAEVAEVKGDGEYKVSYTAATDADDIMMLILSTDLKNGTFGDDFNITAKSLKVGSTEYALNTDEGNLMFADGDVENGCLRYNVRNPYNQKVYRNKITEAEGENCIVDENGDKITCDNIIDANGEITKAPVKAGDVIEVTFDVTGCDSSASVQPTATASQSSVTTPAAATTKPAVTTPSAVQGTKKVSLSKKKIVVAAGKSANLTIKTTVDSPATKAATVTASSKSKKVAKASINGSKVKINVPKKAVKGASTVVTVKSQTASGKAVSAKVTVYVKNATKKVKAAKKTVTVKKNKTAKVTFKVTAQNKKKATTDTVLKGKKVAKISKVATVKSVKATKGKVVVTIKAKKKAGKKPLTVKLGSKKAKVNVVVK